MKIKLKDYLFNIISPPRCISCNCRLPLEETAMFCYRCSKEYYPNNKATCASCGKPIYQKGDAYCVSCKNTKIHYIKNVSRYIYKGSVKNAIQNMKFQKQAWIAFRFGNALAKTVKNYYGDIKFDMIIYVPMSPLNEKKRGFNQSYEIAFAISEKLKIPILYNILYKKPGIKTQSSLKGKDRAENVKNAFFVRNSHLLEDKVILLIDDVFTTGSTINECAKVLKHNGAMAVYSATLASVALEE